MRFYRVRKVFMRPLCFARFHRNATTMLLALASMGGYWRCPWCNRLIARKAKR